MTSRRYATGQLVDPQSSLYSQMILSCGKLTFKTKHYVFFEDHFSLQSTDNVYYFCLLVIFIKYY